ncbi:fimbria/pilus periplasmic chaperone [Solimicrobium silvestre]|uniref:P pilus assembly protein chaperone PapD n=1 Tax=Solimicrobium silvestre TaxID=2099400 RepID=A0A2S9H048_9BURK|nr:fimbria/pilus periplasmic chaperone [Solimicrobium silvestre]PRC93351.1 P pilus assembly protein chaperone PapD [Solimicrobium silvestre]
MLFTAQTHANIVINGTRVIYDASDKEVTLRLNNATAQPSLVQVWLDSGDARSTPDNGKSPFIATPPIFRVDSNKGQTVRIVYTHEPLPQDKESVFWVNVLDVPPMPIAKKDDDANYMQLAIRSRIKLFFRPKNLPGTPVEAAAQIHWELVQKPDGLVLHATNDSAFHVSLGSTTLIFGDKSYEASTEMLAPGTSLDFPIKELKKIPTEPVKLNYLTVNDFGGIVEHSVSLLQ